MEDQRGAMHLGVRGRPGEEQRQDRQAAGAAPWRHFYYFYFTAKRSVRAADAYGSTPC